MFTIVADIYKRIASSIRNHKFGFVNKREANGHGHGLFIIPNGYLQTCFLAHFQEQNYESLNHSIRVQMNNMLIYR